MNVLAGIVAATTLPLWAVWAVAVVVLVLGSARFTRVVYYDEFPPSLWLREAWDKITGESKWNLLLHCPWCLGFWAAVAAAGWFGVGLVVDWIMVAWWIAFGLLSLGYLVPMVIVRDDPE